MIVARIREDLDGSVYLHTGGPDGPVVLFAGDEVPKGSEVGAHLLAPEEPAEATKEEGGAADESGDTAPTEDSVPAVGPEPADTGEGPIPEPAPAKRAKP